MLKQFSIMIAVLFVVLAITGCMEYEPENAVMAELSDSYTAIDVSLLNEGTNTEIEIYEAHEDEKEFYVSRVEYLWFTSLEEFLDAYVAASEGRVSSDLNTEAITRHVDFASLGEIHLLTNIPEAFQIAQVTVFDTAITFVYSAKGERDIHDEWSNPRSNPYFQLHYTRWTYEDLESWGINSPLEGIMLQNGFTENDFIDGKYLYCERTHNLYWAEGSNRFRLTMPDTPERRNDASRFSAAELELMAEIGATDMLTFAETVTVDLRDENNIAAWRSGDFSMFDERLLQRSYPPIRGE